MRKWRSRVTTDGLDRAPHRAFMRAMGLDDASIAKPMIGVVSMKGEQTPCNMTHDFQVAAAKEGITEAGGCPREFATVSVSDGINSEADASFSGNRRQMQRGVGRASGGSDDRCTVL